MTARRRLLPIVVFIALAAFAGVSTLAAAAQPPAQITIKSFSFGPPLIKVAAGSTVTWINQDDEPHTIVAQDGAFRSDALDTGDKFSFTFAMPGSYAYFCTLHPQMTGTVEVTSAPLGH